MHALWKIKRNLSFLPLNIKIFIYVNNNLSNIFWI
ncbi:putative hypothetical protein domain protein [Mycoplasmoides gallisepticum CA06_2006.052-5-2P]|uniref:Uncharacterized protein n=1 Tax=Mycoplasmoides gallisepticum WI01_2001.043-13-2P TaxID=1159201 RepID=J3YTQ7_MYCGL|nr:putative hypothetical protein domain protein [Mycoplasmoides gallisepticum VA94_7994-1-7P]AFP77066.1 putative hypothetical protein domain protein [Mycoplasmoides gallisepticum NC95_13295-2-2P]AFP77824.1 putative hypothetical protein domain protein [Mycoplasmoides gallisepticum NC96_1596-4-2P]AFP78590.1 putative hypothetical protein domain protein [Mycoplasmoides gallisepticum NY01_2001.047-5-1P]AFP79351.1 putative hypothetical protein domain protein [Mycoplasmoides gallisepticum WI01_2001.04